MILPMLAVDSDIQVSLREQAIWDKHEIPTVRVDSMQEAIEKLNKKSFVFTAINADNIHYLPLLAIMRDITPTPIFIIASNFSMSEQIVALHHGADGYASFENVIGEHILLALALLHRYNERGKEPNKLARIISYENLFLFPSFRQTFCNDKEIVLTKTEFDLLCFLMKTQRIVFTHEQIFRNVWGEDYVDSSNNVLWCHVKALRRKLKTQSCIKNYIKTVRGVGYSFDPS